MGLLLTQPKEPNDLEDLLREAELVDWSTENGSLGLAGGAGSEGAERFPQNG